MKTLRFFSFARRFLALAAVLPGVLAAGCQSDVDGGGGDGATCTLEGETYDAGESFPAPDGCNTCTCTEQGDVACTLMACVEGCVYKGETYSPGQSFYDSEICGPCTCDEGGNVSCAGGACAVCVYEGGQYNPGDSFPASDGCNTCSCMNDGSVACTEMACADTCTYAGTEHQVGASFPSIDGCNTCWCEPGGFVSCTEIACPCDPANEWWREYTSLDAQQCLAIDFSCPPNTLRFDNTCGCGCEQDAACPQAFDCMPPASCDEQALMEQCPYSEIVY